MPRLTLRLLPTPDFAALTPVQQEQFQFIEGYTGNLTESVSLTQFFAIDDENGTHVYDMHLFCGEDGQVFVAGTKEPVATFSQGGASADDPALEDPLDDALDRWTE